MSIREYSMTRDSTRQLSPSFKVREFACKGSDTVLIDDELVVLLQCIREHFGKTVPRRGQRCPQAADPASSGSWQSGWPRGKSPRSSTKRSRGGEDYDG